MTEEFNPSSREEKKEKNPKKKKGTDSFMMKLKTARLEVEVLTLKRDIRRYHNTFKMVGFLCLVVGIVVGIVVGGIMI